MILYKYYPCNINTLKSLSALGLWCDHVESMNDPLDCLNQLGLTFSPISYVITLISPNILKKSSYEEIEALRDIFNLFSIKTIDWAYEKEWRIWQTSKPKYFRYEAGDLKSVYFGYRCAEETKTLIKNILAGHGINTKIFYDIKLETSPIRLIV